MRVSQAPPTELASLGAPGLHAMGISDPARWLGSSNNLGLWIRHFLLAPSDTLDFRPEALCTLREIYAARGGLDARGACIALCCWASVSLIHLLGCHHFLADPPAGRTHYPEHSLVRTTSPAMEANR